VYVKSEQTGPLIIHNEVKKKKRMNKHHSENINFFKDNIIYCTLNTSRALGGTDVYKSNNLVFRNALFIMLGNSHPARRFVTSSTSYKQDLIYNSIFEK
jgi:hypothetical protein